MQQLNPHKVFESASTAKVYALYVSECDGKKMPSRTQLDLFDVPKQLPYLYIVDIVEEDGKKRFKFRLMGRKLAELLKHDGTGGFVRELPLGGWEIEWRKTLVYVAEIEQPAVALDKLKLPNGLVMELEHLALPLSDDGENCTHILGAIDFLGYEHRDLKKVTREINWSELEGVDVPKRLLITNLAVPLEE